MPGRPLLIAWRCLWTTLLAATTASAAANAPAKPHQGTAEFSAALSIWLHADATARRHTGNAETTTARTSDVPHAARGIGLEAATTRGAVIGQGLRGAASGKMGSIVQQVTQLGLPQAEAVAATNAAVRALGLMAIRQGVAEDRRI